MGVWRQQKALERLEDRLARVETTCSDLERERKKLDLEFTDLYDKVRRQMSRMAKRYAVDAKEDGDPMETPINSNTSPGTDPISEKIIARRSGGFLQQ